MFTIENSFFGKNPTLEITDKKNNSSYKILLKGLTLLELNIPVNGKIYNIVDGYKTPDEFSELAGSRCCLMAPYSNRLRNFKYTFNKKKYDLSKQEEFPKPIHGLFKYIEYKIIKQEVTEDYARIVFSTDEIKKGKFKGYNFNLDYFVTITFRNNCLDWQIDAQNNSNEAVPFGCGWHPYFKTSDDGVDHLELEIPCSEVVLLDSEYCPLEDKSPFSEIENHPEIDFRPEVKNKVIGKREVNACFSGLKFDSDCLIRSSITDKENAIKISVYQNKGVMYAFTADTVKYRPRKSIAIEPVEFITNAFNRKELQDVIKINAGEARNFNFGVEWSNL